MEVVDLIDKVLESDAYKAWQSDGFYLAHLFRTMEDTKWQVGFWNAEQQKIITFYVERDTITRSEEDEVFKEPDKRIEALNPNTLNIDWEEALKTAEPSTNGVPVTKTFFILQSQEGHDIYNITFLTQTLHTVNVQIDAQSGEILRQKKESIMDMASWEKGEKDE